MSEKCDRPFDEALLSGYLDHALTQEEAQRVRIHVEDCAACRRLLNDLETMREATMSTSFEVPSDDQWKEAPRGAVSGLAFGLGWIMIIVWMVGIAGFAIWQLLTGPEGLLEKTLVFSGISAVGLLFLSVVIDRLSAMKHDRYRRVQK